MSHATGSPRDAASVLFDLPGYRVVDAVDLPEGSRQVVIAAVTGEEACPSCGVLSARVHSRRRQRLRDVPVAGRVRVVLVKRRFACPQPRCPRRTFVEVSDEVPLRARLTTRLRGLVLDAVVRGGRAVSAVAQDHDLSWRTVQATVTAAAVLLTDPDTVPVRRLGIDEHRYRSVRWFRDDGVGVGASSDGSVAGSRWRRVEPWMTTFVDLDTGRVLGVVDGRDSAAVNAWLGGRSRPWRDAVEVVAIDPSAAFRKAVREQLPTAAVSVDAFHLVQLANDMVTRVRQRLSQQRKGRRGRLVDPSWANRRLLLRAGDRLSPAALARLRATFLADDPTGELSAAWAVKEQLRRLLATSTLAQAGQEKMRLGAYVLAARTAETDRLWATVRAWWPAIEVLIVTGVTNARTEAANTGIKHIKRGGRGYRNPHNYRVRILLSTAARRAA